MARQSKGFLNLNRFKSGKAIKQQVKRIGADRRNRLIGGGVHSRSK